MMSSCTGARLAESKDQEDFRSAPVGVPFAGTLADEICKPPAVKLKLLAAGRGQTVVLGL